MKFKLNASMAPILRALCLAAVAGSCSAQATPVPTFVIKMIKAGQAALPKPTSPSPGLGNLRSQGGPRSVELN